MKRLFILPIILLATFSLVVPNLQAQSEEPTPTPEPASQDPERSDIPLVHTVQEGETLFSIAQQYDTTVEVLQQLNNIADPSFIYIGQELILPGGGGETVATIHTIQIGDSLKSIAAIYNTTVEALAGENRLINPAYLAAGNPLTIMSRTGTAEPQPFAGYAHVVRPGDTLLTIAAEHNLTPAQIAAANDLPYPPYLFLGQRLRIPGEGQYQILPGYWQQVRMVPATLVQGKSAAIYVESLEPGLPDGQFAGQSLNFVPHGAGYLAFVGLDAFTDTGRYELLLGGTGDEPGQSFSQEVEVISGEYGIQSLTIPEQLSHLLAPEVRADEEALLAPIFTQVNQPAQWTGLFQMPVSNAPISAGYGDARSYNEGPIEIFHTGIDFVDIGNIT